MKYNFKIYADEERRRAIMVDEEGYVLASYGLKNVLGCVGESLCDTEELVECDEEFNWEEHSFEGLLIHYKLNLMNVSKRFDIPYRTVQNWYEGTNSPVSYVVKMMEELLKLDSVSEQAYSNYLTELTNASEDEVEEILARADKDKLISLHQYGELVTHAFG